MSKIKIYTVPKGNIEALYVNGELFYENPKITIYDLIPHTPIESIEIIHIANFDSDEDYFPMKESNFNQNWRFEERL
jgi:hypothetical protein